MRAHHPSTKLQRMHMWTFRSLRWAFPLTLALIGLVIGYRQYLTTIEPPDQWNALGAPPVPIARLMAARIDTIYVETQTGQLFSCYRESPLDQDCWVSVTSVPEETLGCDQIGPSRAPPAPGVVVQQLRAVYCLRSPAYEGYHEYQYVLLETGMVFQWVSSPLRLFLPPKQANQFNQQVFGGCFTGLAIGGMSMWLVRRWIARHTAPAEKRG
jgi:hypothetical protein